MSSSQSLQHSKHTDRLYSFLLEVGYKELVEDCHCSVCMNNSAHEEEEDGMRATGTTFWRKHPSAFEPKSGQHTRKGGCSCKQSGCRKPFCKCYASKFSFSGRYQWLSRSLYESNEVDHIYNFSYNEDNIVNDSTDGQLLQLLQEDKGIYDIFNR